MVQTPRYLVIPSAGLGTRMKAIHPTLPKEMLPIGSKPAITYTIEEGMAAGIENIIIIMNKGKESIREYLEGKSVMKRKIPNMIFLYQEEPLGESDAISLARDHTQNSPVAFIYPDNIHLPIPGALKKLKDVYQRYGMDVTGLMVVTNENATGLGNSGRVDLARFDHDVFRILRIHPKGKGSFIPRFPGELRKCGMWITGPHIFDYIEQARKIQEEEEFTDIPVKRLILQERGILGCRLPGMVFDIGNPQGYKCCVSFLLNKSIG